MNRCKVCGKEQKYLTKGMCHKHYYQFRKYGEVLDNNATTRLDKHKVEVKDNYVEVILNDNRSNEVDRFKLDKEDTDKVLDIKWSYNKKYNYVFNREVGNKLEYYLLNINRENYKIIFINKDKLDFRKNNLKVITIKEYKKQFKHVKNTSGINGVSFDKSKNRWKAKISHAGRNIHLGTFINKEDAIKARKDAENLYF
ncbi:AP2 domain [uncultured Clostridium sp.]|nr:AP2 domain [uncultured Clostridium sp.]SCI89780.1 AP2 domain [uncultured Clostridium sp.]